MIISYLTEVYSKLRTERHETDGLYERRLSISKNIPVYLGIELPIDFISFSLIVPDAILNNLKIENSNGFDLVLIKNPGNKETKVLIRITDKKFQDVFLILAADLIQELISSEDPVVALSRLDKRLEYWRNFLKQPIKKSLSREEHLGLIGELLVLKELLLRSLNNEILTSWRGPLGAAHDFSFPLKSIEVKTSSVKSKNFVNISSEHQLDFLPNENLYLLQVLIEECSDTSGDTLGSLVKEILSLLNDELKIAFSGLLLCAGCSLSEIEKYDELVFRKVEFNSFKVDEDFPRIARSELKENVLRVQYKLSLTGLEKYKIDTDFLMGNLLNANIG